MVGVTRLELATSCTPSKHSSQTELHPETVVYYSIEEKICKALKNWDKLPSVIEIKPITVYNVHAN